MANVITPNIGIELPTPGVTGGLGVEPSGQSWLELLNTGFSKVDAHDHGAAGGAPLGAASFAIDDALTFNGFDAIDLRSTRYVNHAGVLGGASDDACVYFVNGDLYVNNGSGVAVRVTNGTSVAGAAGNITGLSGAAAVTWNSGISAFIFEASSGVKAGIQVGPLSIFDAVAGGKKVTVSAPSGLAADYALTLPGALPAALGFVQVSAAGVLTFDTDVTDNASLQQVAGVLSVKDGGITRAKLEALGAASASFGSATPLNATSYTLLGSPIDLTTSGRAVLVIFNATGIELTADAGGVRQGYIDLERSDNGGSSWLSTAGSVRMTAQASTIVQGQGFACYDAPGAGAHKYRLVYKVSNASASMTVGLVAQLVAYEL